MQQQTKLETKDWKKEFIYYSKSNQKLKVTSNNSDILSFFNSYFEDLKEELNGISDGIVEHAINEYDGEFYAVINGYKSAKLRYYIENHGVVLKSVTKDVMNTPDPVSKRKAWLIADDNIPFIKTSFEFDGTPKGDAKFFEVKMLDEIVEAYFIGIIQD